MKSTVTLSHTLTFCEKKGHRKEKYEYMGLLP